MEYLNTPILVIIYKRSKTLKKVIESIKKVKPKKIYFAANAPASNNSSEVRKVLKTRDLIKTINWECEIKRLFHKKHLIASESISSGISWFFENENEGIIIEDDCVLSRDFYFFSQELLKKYRDNKSVFQICASNFQDGNIRNDGDYYFSRFNHIWGWASWKRSWEKFDLSLNNFDQAIINKAIDDNFNDFFVRIYWKIMVYYSKQFKYDTWDFQWMICMWIQKSYCITPNVNLVRNIGFGKNSTNTDNSLSKWSNMEEKNLPRPWLEPALFELNDDADKFTMNEFFWNGKNKFYNIFRMLIISILPKKLKNKLKIYKRRFITKLSKNKFN